MDSDDLGLLNFGSISFMDSPFDNCFFTNFHIHFQYEVHNDAAVPNPNPNSEALLKVRENGKWYIYMTAYFTDPNNICRIGKRTCGRESSVVGDRLVFLHRGNKYMDIPLSEEQLKGTKWVQGNCAPRMGKDF